jgi:hypothetical protein
MKVTLIDNVWMNTSVTMYQMHCATPVADNSLNQRACNNRLL